MNILSEDMHKGKTPTESATGYTPDISAYIHLQFYDPVYYYDQDEKFPSTKEKLGRWLGPVDHVGDQMTYHILTNKNTIISRSTICPATNNSTLNKRRQATSCDEGGVQHLKFQTLNLKNPQRLFPVEETSLNVLSCLPSTLTILLGTNLPGNLMAHHREQLWLTT